MYIAVRCAFKLPSMPHYACYMRRIIALPIFHCSANLLCFSNIKCSIKQPLTRVLSLIAPILKIPRHHTFTHKAAIRFLSSLHQLLYFLPLSIFEGGTAFYCSPIFHQWSRGVWFWTPIIVFCFCPFCPFPLWGMTCKFLLPFFVVFPFTATFCRSSLFRYIIKIANLWFFSVRIFEGLLLHLLLYINLHIR